MNRMSGISFICAFARARHLDRLRTREALEAIQQSWLARLTRYATRSSAYYRPLADKAFREWPVVDKLTWMSCFDQINTVGARLSEITSLALRAEATRDFSAVWKGYSFGLSTGTSGNRGLFLASRQESALWAGTLLAKLMRRSIFSQERIALILRAGAVLYENIGALRLQFRYFDQSRPWPELIDDLRSFNPTILVAPASALRLLAHTDRQLQPTRVISVAEVLDDLDRQHIERRFSVSVEQIYQATEGLLGISCEHGAVHINEPYLLVEPEWQDAAHTRFIPIITDLWRHSQPVIRYRLNDILRVGLNPCPCGRASLALAAIEGREDDVLWLDSAKGAVAVFPDQITRAIVGALPDIDDYQVAELRRGLWRVSIRPMHDPSAQQLLQEALNTVTGRLGANPATVLVSFLEATTSSGKQRRVRSADTACAS
jgi:putative adenylate-forming enzyme